MANCALLDILKGHHKSRVLTGARELDRVTFGCYDKEWSNFNCLSEALLCMGEQFICAVDKYSP